MGAIAESHSRTLGRAQGVLLKMGRKKQRNQRGQGQNTMRTGPTEPNDLVSREFAEIRELQDCAIGLLHICYGWEAWCSCERLGRDSKGCVRLFWLLLRPFSSSCVALSNGDVMVCAWSCCNLIFLFGWCLWEATSFLRRVRQEGVKWNLGRRKMGYKLGKEKGEKFTVGM